MRHILFFALLCMAPVLLANVAQPGIWQAGGAGAFTPLFAEDSSAFRQVQMVREQVDIQLYPGFSVPIPPSLLSSNPRLPNQLSFLCPNL